MSLSDFNSDSRGPVFVGTALGALVLIGFMVLGVFTLDERFQGGGEKIEAKIATAQSDIGSLKERIAHAEMKMRDYEVLGGLQAKVKAASGAVESAESSISVLRDDIESLELAYKDYVADYRAMVRGDAEGLKMDMLKTLAGDTYHDVKVIKVSALGMSIMHREGSCRIPYQELDAEMQEHYQFSEDEAMEVKEAEADLRLRHNRATAAVKNTTRVREIRERERKEQDEALQRQRAISYLQTSIASIDNTIRRLNDQILIESTKRLSRAPILREELSAAKQQKREMEQKLRKLYSTR